MHEVEIAKIGIDLVLQPQFILALLFTTWIQYSKLKVNKTNNRLAFYMVKWIFSNFCWQHYYIRFLDAPKIAIFSLFPLFLSCEKVKMVVFLKKKRIFFGWDVQ